MCCMGVREGGTTMELGFDEFAAVKSAGVVYDG